MSAPAHRSGFVALAGCPNVGKSTLLNRLLGEEIAVATSMPQTTRRTLRGILTLPGSQIVFLDTPGIHEPHNRLNEAMVASAREAMRDADLIVFMVDAGRPPGDGDRNVVTVCAKSRAQVILGLNKWDTVPEAERAERRAAYEALGDFAAVEAFSALDKTAASVVLPLLLPRLPEGPPYYPEEQLTDQTLRDLICELVREQVIAHCAQEVPHHVAVAVEKYTEEDPRDGADHVWAVIYVERDSQKGILVGKGGRMIRTIGTAARLRMGEVIGRTVHLRLHIKVRPGWRKDTEFLRELGFTV
ncbi:MAG: GTPase Era [Nitrospirota bacterium]|nr:GTPase Era [Nitrospirota bacterium]